jgi:hypothetical protein
LSGAVSALDGDSHIHELEQRRPAHFVRTLMSKQFVVKITRSGAIRINGDIETTHQCFAS